jgi:hypothetical protein
MKKKFQCGPKKRLKIAQPTFYENSTDPTPQWLSSSPSSIDPQQFDFRQTTACNPHIDFSGFSISANTELNLTKNFPNLATNDPPQTISLSEDPCPSSGYQTSSCQSQSQDPSEDSHSPPPQHPSHPPSKPQTPNSLQKNHSFTPNSPTRSSQETSSSGSKISLHYSYNGNLKYRGKSKNQLPHGKNCTLFNKVGNVEYFGPIKEGQKYGLGKSYNLEGNLEYEGLFVKGGPHGENCKIYQNNGVSVKY